MSADTLDQAADLTTAMAEYSINTIRKLARADTSNPSGTCLYCEAETDLTRRWCDAACRDNWQRGEE